MKGVSVRGRKVSSVGEGARYVSAEDDGVMARGTAIGTAAAATTGAALVSFEARLGVAWASCGAEVEATGRVGEGGGETCDCECDEVNVCEVDCRERGLGGGGGGAADLRFSKGSVSISAA